MRWRKQNTADLHRGRALCVRAESQPLNHPWKQAADRAARGPEGTGGGRVVIFGPAPAMFARYVRRGALLGRLREASPRLGAHVLLPRQGPPQRRQVLDRDSVWWKLFFRDPPSGPARQLPPRGLPRLTSGVSFAPRFSRPKTFPASRHRQRSSQSCSLLTIQ